ncbi:MAG: hypothetical protein VX945_01765 [Verrucomicrobiota bacterium]|nr:hypothetical protein [Verrucomicrobiota bacterium]
MKQLLLVCAVMALVGCGDAPPDLRNRLVLEEAIRDELEKPEGKLTEEDFAKVTNLILTGEQQVGDVWLKEVAKLQNLKNLFLDNTRITDDGLKELTKLQKLEDLSLLATEITDDGLKDMVKMQQLKSLYLVNTKVTKAGVAELKKALPNCEIHGP